DNDAKVRRDERRTQTRSELTFGQKGAAPVEVHLADDRTIRFRGSADRVDSTADGELVVTDYKSGKAEAFKSLSETNPTQHGSKLQLPVYAHAARAELGTPETAVRA